MKRISNFPISQEIIESRLLWFAAFFMLCFSIILTLSPAARFHSWQVEYRIDHWAGFVIWAGSFTLLHRKMKVLLPDHDPYLLPISALLSGWGILTIWRLDPVFGMRQSLWLVVSLFIFWLGLRSKDLLQTLRGYKYIWLICGLLLTATTFFFGTYPAGEGPHLWLGCCGIYFQPSEPLKLLFIIYLSAYLADQLLTGTTLIRLLTPTILLIGSALTILLSQHDLGTTSIYILLYFTIIFLVVGKRRFLALSVFALISAGLIGYRLYPIIHSRLDSWINPWLDPDGKSYQIIQSLIAIATGSVFGRGIGIGNPGVIPVAHSDFIFSAISEETGLVGSFGLIILIALVIWRGFTLAYQASNQYRRYLAAGITIYLALQSILIISGNLRLLPLTGVTLPFVSYGGSSLLTSFLTLLILMLVSSRPDEEPAPLSITQPYNLLQTAFLACLAILALVNGYWAFIQSGDLQTRHDNPRLYISDLYVPRGKILDRNNDPITITIGTPGNYFRYSNYPALSPVVGYSSSIYGQAGLEEYLDPYLRGIKGNSAITIWINHLLYGESPPGLNVRLSIDLGLQQKADELLGKRTGSVILLNARTGEILAMASHPYFDPNHLDENWGEWNKNDNAHLLNRASLGAYPPGSALGPFLLTAAIQENKLGAFTGTLDYTFSNTSWKCASFPIETNNWGSIITSGCPGASTSLMEKLGAEQVGSYLTSLGFGKVPDVGLPSAPPPIMDPSKPFKGLDPSSQTFLVSPLQVVTAAAVLSASGSLTEPSLGFAVETPQEGWIIIHSSQGSQVIRADSTITTMRLLAIKNLPAWGTLAISKTQSGFLTWYLGGTTPDWKGNPLAFVVALEENDPSSASRIGQEMIKDILIAK